MHGWREFRGTHDRQKAYYTVVSNEYADYCSSICSDSPTGHKSAFRNITRLVGALEYMVLEELSKARLEKALLIKRDGTD